MRFLKILVLVIAILSISKMAEAGKEKIKIFNARTGSVEEVEKVIKSESQWQKILTPEQFRIMRLKDTEPPFQGLCPIPSKGKKGIYQCAGCATDLFVYTAKFESGSGWPSFWEPVSPLNIRIHEDKSFHMQREEVLCARCDAHLGHVFNDGPPPSGKRYCINGKALKLSEVNLAAFAAGCFWGTEAAFRKVRGVLGVTSGFMGGTLKNPSYEEVSAGRTGHAETVLVEFDPDKVSYEELLDVFWGIHDPTTANRQGPDIGSQYRSVIFYYTAEQKEAIRLSKEKLQKSGVFKGPIVTEIVPAKDFYKAEEYHQRYYEKHNVEPTCHIPRSLKK